jgi:RNA polymerase sigma-70 factor (ECF subfamily)
MTESGSKLPRAEDRSPDHDVDILLPAQAPEIAVPTSRPRSTTADGDDVALVEACRRGERRAMEALYHRYKRRVFGLVTRITGHADAEEVAQEVFVRIFRGLAKFRGDSQLGTWVYRLAVNAALSHATRRPRIVDAGGGTTGSGEDRDPLADLAAPEQPDRDPRLAHKLESALAALPAGYRAVIVLHDVEGLSHEEIAEILGCRIGTSKSQLHKARGRMRELLGPALAAERQHKVGAGR